MKTIEKQFLVTVKYPVGDYIASSEFIDVINEAIESRMETLPEYFDANIMDGESGRLVTTVKEIDKDYNTGALTLEERTHIEQIILHTDNLFGSLNKYSSLLRTYLREYDIVKKTYAHSATVYEKKCKLVLFGKKAFTQDDKYTLVLSPEFSQNLLGVYGAKLRKLCAEVENIVDKITEV